MPSFNFLGNSYTSFFYMSSVFSENLGAQERRAGLSLASIYAFRMFGIFMIMPVFALYGETLPGATPMLMGLALGIYGLTQAALQIPFAMWSDKIGRKPVLYIGLLIFAAGSIAAANAETIEGIIFGRALQGAGAIAATLMALAADLSREEHRMKMMALIGASIGAAFALSMVLGPSINALVGISGIFYGTALLAVIGMLLLYFVVPDPINSRFHRDAQLKPSSLADVFKDSQLLRLDAGIFILHFVLMCLFLVMPLLLRDFVGLPAEQHWKIYIPVFVVSLVIMLPFIILAEKKQAMKSVFVGSIVAIILATLGFLGSTSSNLFIFSLVLFFAGFNLLEASLPSLISKTADATQKGTAMGVYSSSQFLGAFAGGAMGGVAHQFWGFQGVYLTVLAALLFWLVLAVTMKKPEHLSTYLLNVNDVSVDQLLAVEGVVEAALIQDEKESGYIAYLKIKKHILDEEKLLSLAASD
jgi:MFS family permease